VLGVQQGKRVVVAEVSQRADVAHVVAAAGADHLSIDPQEAMEEYLRDQLPSALADTLASSRAFGYLAAATPGMRELLTAGKIWELAQDARRAPGTEPYDLVVVDAPATGHGVAVLAAPKTFADTAMVGPVARQGRIIFDMLSDPARTAVVAVTTPEEMPVNETLALRDALGDQVGQQPALVVVNALRRARLSADEAARVEAEAAADGHPALRAALTAHRHAAEQRAQLRRLRRATAGVRTATLPFVPGEPDVARLAGRLREAVA
jgi:anion-transporting  ArsA/GET3 family ATPase